MPVFLGWELKIVWETLICWKFQIVCVVNLHIFTPPDMRPGVFSQCPGPEQIQVNVQYYTERSAWNSLLSYIVQVNSKVVFKKQNHHWRHNTPYLLCACTDMCVELIIIDAHTLHVNVCSLLSVNGDSNKSNIHPFPLVNQMKGRGCDYNWCSKLLSLCRCVSLFEGLIQL
jgi:hypothetical protein